MVKGKKGNINEIKVTADTFGRKEGAEKAEWGLDEWSYSRKEPFREMRNIRIQ